MDTHLLSINKSYINGILYGYCFLSAFIIYVSNVKRKTSKEPRNSESEEQNKTKKSKQWEPEIRQCREENRTLGLLRVAGGDVQIQGRLH